jgi:hypothetical protein
MHEWSQTASLVDWKSLPYEYASGDSTELLPMAMNDYLKISGDGNFIRTNWDALERAWQFETTHTSANGIYNNGQGTGWVESWIPTMPQQEIYLAALDEQASLAFANLAHATGHDDLAAQARDRAAKNISCPHRISMPSATTRTARRTTRLPSSPQLRGGMATPSSTIPTR